MATSGRLVRRIAGADSVRITDDFGTEEWWHHDRLGAHRNVNLGLGFDYFLSPLWKVSATGYTSLWAEQTNEVDYAFTTSLTRFFSRN